MSCLPLTSKRLRQLAFVMGGLCVEALLFGAASLFTFPCGAQELASGSGKVDARGSVYTDDDETTIITSYVGTELGLPGGARFGAHGLVDIISTASVDVVAAATSSFEEVRVEFGARAGMVVSEGVDLGLAFVRSAENDWTSYSPQLTSSFELFEKNTTLSFGYGFSYNQVGRSGDPNFEQRLDAHTTQLGVTQLLDKKTLLGAAYTLSFAKGWQSSPYRYVRIAAGPSVLERHPETRLRHAGTLNALRHLRKGLALDGSYRFYGDDWGVMSHTATAALRMDFSRHFDARLRVRGYYQSAAEFWQESYTQTMRYMSLDRELGTFWDVGGGAKIGWHNSMWEINVKADAIYYRVIDFSLLDSRLALVTDLGVGLKW